MFELPIEGHGLLYVCTVQLIGFLHQMVGHFSWIIDQLAVVLSDTAAAFLLVLAAHNGIGGRALHRW